MSPHADTLPETIGFDVFIIHTRPLSVAWTLQESTRAGEEECPAAGSRDESKRNKEAARPARGRSALDRQLRRAMDANLQELELMHKRVRERVTLQRVALLNPLRSAFVLQEILGKRRLHGTHTLHVTF